METMYPPTPNASTEAFGIAPARRHTPLGIASLITACVALALMFSAFAISIAISAGAPSRGQAGFMLVGLLIVGSSALALIALVLGIAGICQHQYKRLTAGLGILFSIVALLIIVLLLLLGRNAPGTLDRHAGEQPYSSPAVSLQG